ncbi:hypothetical protein [Streptomyces chartreusis]
MWAFAMCSARDERSINAVIEEFSTTVLKLGTGQQWCEAVHTALMGRWVERTDTDLLVDDVSVIRAEAGEVHTQLTPLWRRKTGGTRILLLDTPLGHGVSLHDLISGSPDPQDLALGLEPDDVRLRTILNQLQPAERQIALAWAQKGVRTWTEAATAAGASDPIAAGERVRLKLKRLHHRWLTRRAATNRH